MFIILDVKYIFYIYVYGAMRKKKKHFMIWTCSLTNILWLLGQIILEVDIAIIEPHLPLAAR